MSLIIIFLLSCGGDDDDDATEDEFTFEGTWHGSFTSIVTGPSVAGDVDNAAITIEFGPVIDTELSGVYFLTSTAQPRYGGDNDGIIRIFLKFTIEENLNTLEKTFEITKVIIQDHWDVVPECVGINLTCTGNYEGTGIVDETGAMTINYEGGGVGCGDCWLQKEFKIVVNKI